MRKMMCLLLALLCLTSCSSVSLGDRAVVKAVYLEQTEEGFAASLVVYGCDPTTDAASAQGKAAIYSGTGGDVPQALADAESRQTKEPFYAQNGLLLLGKNCMERDPAPILSYFGEEDASRKDIAVYLTHLSPEEFDECEENISDVIREAERTASSSGGRGAFGVHEADCLDGFSGLLPVLDFSDESESASVGRALLYADGMPRYALEDAQLQLAMLLLGKSSELTLDIPADDGKRLDVSAKGISVRKNMSGSWENGVLHLEITGTMLSLSRDGRALYGTDARKAVDEVNTYLETELQALAEKTFLEKNDLFGFVWWMQGLNSERVSELASSGEIYRADRLSFRCRLRYE